MMSRTEAPQSPLCAQLRRIWYHPVDKRKLTEVHPIGCLLANILRVAAHMQVIMVSWRRFLGLLYSMQQSLISRCVMLGENKTAHLDYSRPYASMTLNAKGALLKPKHCSLSLTSYFLLFEHPLALAKLGLKIKCRSCLRPF